MRISALNSLLSSSHGLHSHPYSRQPLQSLSIQPSLSLPRTHAPLTFAIDTFLAIRYSFIHSTSPNQLNSLRFTVLANSLYFSSSLLTRYPPYNTFGTIIPSHSHFLHLYSIHYWLGTRFNAPNALYPSFILYTTYISHPPSATTCYPEYLRQFISSKGTGGAPSIRCI